MCGVPPATVQTRLSARGAAVIFKGGPTTHRVTLNAEWQLVLKPDNQPAYRLAPHHGRRFPIIELEGFGVEFVGEATIVDEVIFHQPNGTFVARRLEDSG